MPSRTLRMEPEPHISATQTLHAMMHRHWLGRDQDRRVAEHQDLLGSLLSCFVFLAAASSMRADFHDSVEAESLSPRSSCERTSLNANRAGKVTMRRCWNPRMTLVMQAESPRAQVSPAKEMSAISPCQTFRCWPSSSPVSRSTCCPLRGPKTR